MTRALEFLQRKFADHPELVEKMLPVAPPFSSRPVLVDSDYSVYDALLRDDCTLVTDGIRRIKENGIEVEGGGEYPVDVIVLATGFKANDFLWPMEVRGRDGQLLEQLWEKDGARAYLGTMVPGFPNLFMIYGPNTNATGGLGTFDFEEMVTRFALECIEHLILEGKQTVDVTARRVLAVQRRTGPARGPEDLHRPARQQLLQERARPLGRPTPRSTSDRCGPGSAGPKTTTRSGGQHLADQPASGGAAVRPHFGEDLVVE